MCLISPHITDFILVREKGRDKLVALDERNRFTQFPKGEKQYFRTHEASSLAQDVLRRFYVHPRIRSYREQRAKVITIIKNAFSAIGRVNAYELTETMVYLIGDTLYAEWFTAIDACTLALLPDGEVRVYHLVRRVKTHAHLEPGEGRENTP